MCKLAAAVPRHGPRRFAAGTALRDWVSFSLLYLSGTRQLVEEHDDRRATHTKHLALPSARRAQVPVVSLSMPRTCPLCGTLPMARSIRASDVDACSARVSRLAGGRGRRDPRPRGAYRVCLSCYGSKRREFDSTSWACDKIVPGRGTVLFGCGHRDDIELCRTASVVLSGRDLSGTLVRGYWRL